MTTLQLDKQRGGTIPLYQYFYRKCQEKSVFKLFYKIGLSISRFLYSVELCDTYVNCDIPSHSIVFGNPCIINHCDNATEGYINHKI